MKQRIGTRTMNNEQCTRYNDVDKRPSLLFGVVRESVEREVWSERYDVVKRCHQSSLHASHFPLPTSRFTFNYLFCRMNSMGLMSVTFLNKRPK